MSEPVLEIRDLKKDYVAPGGGERTPVIDVPTLRLEAGEQVALAGESGSGKTTLLHLIAGIVRPDSGSVMVAGHELTRLRESDRDRLRATTIGYIFQTFNLLQGYSALENLLLAMSFAGDLRESRARELLTSVGLADRMGHRPSQLSVGQQQRVAVARALANSPALVLADEPTGNLDRKHAGDALQLIRDLCTETGAALLLVSHDPMTLDQFERRLTLTGINRVLQPEATN